MYTEQFGLTEDPFKITPSLRFVYRGRGFASTLRALRAGLLGRRRFLLLIAPSGLGKTALLKALVEDLGRAAPQVEVALQACRSWSTAESLLAPPDGSRPSVVLLDEAHHLTDAALNDLVAAAQRGYVKLLFAGPPEFADRLQVPDLLRRRLRPLPRAETAAYVRERLAAAGRADPDAFSPEALAVVAAASQGVPRLINRLCSTSIFLAATAGAQGVDAARAREAATTLSLEVPAELEPIEPVERREGGQPAQTAQPLEAEPEAAQSSPAEAEPAPAQSSPPEAPTPAERPVEPSRGSKKAAPRPALVLIADRRPSEPPRRKVSTLRRLPGGLKGVGVAAAAGSWLALLTLAVAPRLFQAPESAGAPEVELAQAAPAAPEREAATVAEEATPTPAAPTRIAELTPPPPPDAPAPPAEFQSPPPPTAEAKPREEVGKQLEAPSAPPPFAGETRPTEAQEPAKPPASHLAATEAGEPTETADAATQQPAPGDLAARPPEATQRPTSGDGAAAPERSDEADGAAEAAKPVELAKGAEEPSASPPSAQDEGEASVDRKAPGLAVAVMEALNAPNAPSGDARAQPETEGGASRDANSQAQAAPPATTPSAAPTRIDPVARDLERARRQMAAGRLTTPAGDNAFETYRRVLEASPGNVEAQRGLDEVAAREVALAESAEARGDWIGAVEHFETAQAIAPDHPAVLALAETRRRAAEAVASAQPSEPPATEAESPAPPKPAEPAPALQADERRTVRTADASEAPRQLVATAVPARLPLLKPQRAQPPKPRVQPTGPLAADLLDRADRIEVAISRGADPNTRYEGGHTPLTLAAQRRRPDIVSVLLRHGADPNAQTRDAATPLMYAAWNGDLVSATFLLEAGADPDQQNADGKTALMAAAMRGHAAFVELLLRNGAPPDAQNLHGWTALMYAAWGGHQDAAEILLRYGADPGIENIEGRTAAALAMSRAQPALARLMGARAAN